MTNDIRHEASTFSPSSRAADDPRLALAIRLARQAGRHAVEGSTARRVGWKGPSDRVTDVDLALESELVTEIRRRLPDDGIVAEEGSATDPGDRKFVRMIDPLDGTDNPGNRVAHADTVETCRGAPASALEGLQ